MLIMWALGGIPFLGFALGQQVWVLAACAAGSLSPNEAKEGMNLIISVQAIEKTGCVEKRVTELERRRPAWAQPTSPATVEGTRLPRRASHRDDR